MGARTSSLITSSSNADAKFVHDLVTQNCVVIFSKTYCSYCLKVKQLFNENGVQYKAIELDQIENGCEIQDVLSDLSGKKTVPRVFINGSCIGGAKETQQLYLQEELLNKIKKCEAMKISTSRRKQSVPCVELKENR